MDNFIDTLSQIDQIYLWDLIGTAVFGVSGVLVGLERRMDVFGMLILAFVTGVGGGTLRDIMIGSIPVFWMNNLTYILMIVISVVLTVIFRKQFSEHWSKSLMLFDTIGLGVFTIIGIEKALRFGLSPTYATACIAGGTVYFLINGLMNHNLVVFITIMVVISVRLLSLKYHWELPKF